MLNEVYVGSNFDDFLSEEGMEAEVTARAIKRLLAWELLQLMEKENITKTALAVRMNTSRAAVNRLLDPGNTSISLHTMEKVAVTLGKKLEIQLT
jgi:predicted DNA-binding protein (UPF0251 family)